MFLRRPAAVAGLVAALILSGPSLGQAPIGEQTRDLYQRWERLQREVMQQRASEFRQEVSPGVRFVLFVENDTTCGEYSLWLAAAEGESDELQFEKFGADCAVALHDVPRDAYTLVIKHNDSSDPGEFSSVLELESGVREVGLTLRDELFGRQLTANVWSGDDAARWWNGAFAWLPGISAPLANELLRLRSRPSWRAISALCGEGASVDGMAQVVAAIGDLPPDQLGDEELSVLAHCALRLRWPEAARDVIEYWSGSGTDNRAYQSARLELARIQLDTGLYPEVISGLESIPFSGFQRLESLHLRSMALMALQRWEEAAQLLASGSHLNTRTDTASLERASDPSLFMRYNLAMSLMHSGQEDKALAVLDALAVNPSNSRVSSHLIDQANLALGWHFLKAGAGATAVPIFERVSLQGPLARQAILGLGWAHIISPGMIQRRRPQPVSSGQTERSPALLRALYQAGQLTCEEYREALADEAVCRRATHFRQAESVSDEQRADKAVTAWSHLLMMPLPDDVSLEGALALADALREQGRIEWAERLYEKVADSSRGQLEALERLPTPRYSKAALEHEHLPLSLRLWLLSAEPQLLVDLIAQVENLGHAEVLKKDLVGRLEELLDQLVLDTQQRLRQRLVDARFKHARLLDSVDGSGR